MRRVAAQVYHLHPGKHAKELQRWSTHSFRVGACILLHGMDFTPTQIKFLLRWKSDAFMVYLRNTAVLARQQHRAMDAAAAMPNFF